eukprot:6934530-Lingulodinium_polyedra.AAC.1
MAQATRVVGDAGVLPPPWRTLGGSCGGHRHRWSAKSTCSIFRGQPARPQSQRIGGRNTRSSA